ncbi:MAG: glycosyltransferase family 4 protein [Acidobacteria bacterium]|uniref:Glycosyltransferase family 4 protein n=1 Tax=Candidatus Polarisedimenticola svalbardensis TaxID=2886004 RepID=A0A8J6XUR2_9BACT|nr:glycosyltransferase family 4 protein [Candidatus Polarisedimenticola svalbardensis]
MDDNRRKVLHLIDSYRIGGPGKTIINSARFIDESKFGLEVASFAPPDEGLNEFGQAVRSAGIRYHGLLETRGFDRSQVRSLRDVLAEGRFDILHCHGYKPDFLGYLACRKESQIRLMTTHHGWIENSTRQRLFVHAGLALTRKMDGTVCVASHLMDRLPARVRASWRTTLIHNALVLEDYVPSGRRAGIRNELGIASNATLIGVVGRLSLEKGCLEALEAFGELHGRVPEVHLAFIGEGPLEGELRARLDASQFRDKVHFTGHQAPVQPWLEALDLLLSPSRTEGLSNVLLEALAFRLPVVATRVGGNGEIIQDQVSGLLVEPLRPDLLAAGMERIVTGPEVAKEMARAGNRTVREAFGFETRMRKMEAFYEQVLAGVPGKAGR